MRLNIITAVLTGLVLCSCGTSRRSYHSHRDNAPSDLSCSQIRLENSASQGIISANERRNNDASDGWSTHRESISFSGIECEHVRVKGINPLPSYGLSLSLDELSPRFCYPYEGKFISDFGMRGNRMHTGIDIKAIPNDTIRAAFPGVVRMAKNYSSYGNIVVIRHYEGFETVYSHGSKLLVSPNDIVEAGTPIALAGRTGRATTEHLHFEVRAGGEPIDPKLLVDPTDMRLRTGWLYIIQHDGNVVASTTKEGLMEEKERLIAEQHLTATARAKAITESATADGTPNGSSIPDPVYHRVRKGDTLSQIARYYKTSVNNICRLNNIKSTSLLQINQRLRVQ